MSFLWTPSPVWFVHLQCGDVGCAKSGKANGLDNTDCCINGVLNNQPDCSVSGEAPCVVTDGKSVATVPRRQNDTKYEYTFVFWHHNEGCF